MCGSLVKLEPFLDLLYIEDGEDPLPENSDKVPLTTPQTQDANDNSERVCGSPTIKLNLPQMDVKEAEPSTTASNTGLLAVLKRAILRVYKDFSINLQFSV